MRGLPLAALTGLALALAGPAVADTPADLLPLPQTVRGPIEPDLAHLPTESLPPFAPIPRYRLLREGDVQCRSTAAATVANLLDRERAQMATDHPPGGHVKAIFPPKDANAWQLRRTVLTYAALEERNRAAGQALPLYFRGAELEAQTVLLRLARTDLIGAIKKGEDLGKKGFRLPVEPATLRKQLLDTEADLVRVRAGLAEVNARLKTLLGVTDLAADEWLWPAVEVQVTFEPLDLEAAVAVGLAKRPELLLLRALASDLDGQTVAVAREYLHGITGLIGTGGPTKHVAARLALRKADLCGGEVALREQQVRQLLVDRERAVGDDVWRAAMDLRSKSRLVALSRVRVETADAHRRDAEQKAERASGNYFEVLTTRLEWYKSRGQLTSDVMAWHTARAKAREAQGVFVWECCGENP
jgi:hypothetical protein